MVSGSSTRRRSNPGDVRGTLAAFMIRDVAHDLLDYGIFRTNYSRTLLYCLLIDPQQLEMYAYIQFRASTQPGVGRLESTLE